MDNKKILLLVVFLLVAGAGFFWFQNNKIKTNEFAGNVVSVGDSSFVVKGTYTIDRISVGTVGELRDVEVLVDSNTQITRESFKIPEGVKSFDPNKLPKQITQVGLDKIKADSDLTTVGVIIQASKNIYGKNKFTASNIVYRVPDF